MKLRCHPLAGVPFFLMGLVALARPAASTTHYELRLNLTEFTGDSLRLAFDLTSGDTIGNVASVLGFSDDGRALPGEPEGGPVSGELVETGPPGDASIRDLFFYNQIVVPFDSVGTQVASALELTESGPSPGGMPDELSFFILRHDGTPAFPTVDPLSSNALLAIDITGQNGGDLSVFAPMRFVPPDTLLLSNSIDDVAPGDRFAGRLQFRSIVPNPSSGGVRLVYAIPEPGGELRVKVFDVAGRLMAQPFNGKRAAGTWTTRWDARDAKGRAVSAGVYLVQLQMGGQSLVRRVVLTR